jgi:hypothetical protein
MILLTFSFDEMISKYVNVLQAENVSHSTIINNIGYIAKYIKYIKDFREIKGDLKFLLF